MQYIADFHIHSKYSRATSSQMDLEYLDKWANIKGIEILGTGDFTHPGWFASLKEKLKPQENGLFKLKNSNSNVNFILTTEISCIYTKNKKTRKIHILIFAPDFDTAEKINAQLSWIGNLKSDGRPILGLDAKELTKIVLDTSLECMVIPAHIWTPWFSLFGSNSGFDSAKECFEELTPYIYAMETGLSSDPAMNWRLSSLDKITLISNSDAHSPKNLGREANVFDLENLSYQEITRVIKEKDKSRFLYTIEFFPEEGKYHWDGHRNCNIRFKPSETKKHNNICPQCGRPLTVGVLNRVETLADRPEGYKPKEAIPYKSLVPLSEIIAKILEQGKETKAVEQEYRNLIKKGKNEFNILLNLPEKELERITLPKIAQGIIKMRQGKVIVMPGYDGVYGTIKIFGKQEEKLKEKQATLF